MKTKILKIFFLIIVSVTTCNTLNNTINNKTQITQSLLNETAKINTTVALTNGTLVKSKKKTMAYLKDTRRKKSRSTSSSSNSASDEKSSKSAKESLDMTVSSSSSSESFEKRTYTTPKSSAERKGWRKWHRKCTQCEEEMHLKWREQRINWICGAYQRARRSFKSECMMYYRNCQDGTMFVKIHDHRCKNDSYHGYHFFYDYKVVISDESSSSASTVSSSSESEDDSSALFSYSEEESQENSDSKRKKKKVTKFIDLTIKPQRSSKKPKLEEDPV